MIVNRCPNPHPNPHTPSLPERERVEPHEDKNAVLLHADHRFLSTDRGRSAKCAGQPYPA